MIAAWLVFAAPIAAFGVLASHVLGAIGVAVFLGIAALMLALSWVIDRILREPEA